MRERERADYKNHGQRRDAQLMYLIKLKRILGGPIPLRGLNLAKGLWPVLLNACIL
jgi:hypothetical protein